jgi:hypothetical protein
MNGEVEELLHHLGSWPYLHIERRTDCAMLRMRDLVVGTLNLVTHALSVNATPITRVTPVGRTGHATGDPPGRDALRAPAALSS